MERYSSFVGMLGMTCLLAPVAVWAASDVHVDIQSVSGTTAAGYIAVTPSNRWDNGTSVDLGDGVRGAWLDSFSAGTGDRGAGYPDVLIRDFVQWTSSQTTPETFKMTGIQVGSYDLKIYAYDPQYRDKNTRFEIDQNNDAVIDQTLTIVNPGEQNKTVSAMVSATGVLSITVSRPTSASAAFCGLDLTSTGPDPSQPAAVSTLAVTSQTLTQVSLRWTAPADDNGAGGKVTAYDVRYGTSPINDGNWPSAVQVTGEPTPADSGAQESFTVRGLACDTTYYFAVKSADVDGRVSPLSNVPTATTLAVTAPPCLALAERVANRTYPSIFQAWNRADNLGSEDARDTIARHDLYWHAPTALKLAWDTATAGGYVLQAEGFTESSISTALQYRADLLSRNPNLVLLAEIRQYEASETSLPADHPWWLRDGSGNRMIGWTGGTGTYYLLDLSNPSLQDHVAAQARAAVKSGVFDGVFLDCWTEFKYANARLALVQKVRAAIGEQALIIVNPNHNKVPLTGPYVNGLFMECYDTSTPAMWTTIADTLIWAEANLKSDGPRVNCLETWYHTSRDDLDLMRAATTLSLTHSNGCALFSDPNPLPAPDHLHNWYAFWDADLGIPLQAGADQTDGSSRREFTRGTAIYNPIGHIAPTVTFHEPRTSVATGLAATTHVVSAGGDIFLLPTGYRQRVVARTPVAADFGLAGGASQTVTVAADGTVQNAFSGTLAYPVWAFSGGSVTNARFILAEDPAIDAGAGGSVGALKYQIVQAPASMNSFGFSYQNITISGATGDVTTAQLAQVRVEFDYRVPSGIQLNCRAEPTGGGWPERADWGTLVGNGQWQHFSKVLTDAANVTAFLGYINAHQKSFRVTFADFGSASDGDANLIDNLSVSEQVVGVVPVGDINGDGYVNVGDLQALVAAWGKARQDAGYDAYADINGDGYVNVGDLQLLVANWGRTSIP